MSEVQPGRILSDERGVRYVEVSAEYSPQPYWTSSVVQKVAGFDGSHVFCCVRGDVKVVSITLTEREFSTLVAFWQQYKVDMEQRPVVAREEEGYDPFLDFE